MRPLAVIFLVIAMACSIGGFSNITETGFEKIKREAKEGTEASTTQLVHKYQSLGVSPSDAKELAESQAAAFLEKYSVELEKLQRERELRMIYWFVPACLLAIIGLICWFIH